MALDEKTLQEALDNLEEVKKDLVKSRDLREETKQMLKRAQEQLEGLKSSSS